MTNATVLCVGGITRTETEALKGDGVEIDGTGYYLFLADEGSPETPIEVLATLISGAAAARLAQLFEARMS